MRRELKDRAWPEGAYWAVDVTKCDYMFKRVTETSLAAVRDHLVQLEVLRDSDIERLELPEVMRVRSPVRLKGNVRLVWRIRTVLKENQKFAEECVNEPGSPFKEYHFGIATYGLDRGDRNVLFVLLFLVPRTKQGGRLVIGEIFAKTDNDEYTHWPSD